MPQAEDYPSPDKVRACQECHRQKDHAAPHHADSGRVWEYWPWIRTRARHYIDCPSRDGRCVEWYNEGGERHQCHRRVGHHGPHHAGSGLAWGGRRRRIRNRERDYTDCPGCGGLRGVVTLFLPQTWPPRFVFLAVTLFSAGILIPGPFDWILVGPGWFFIAAAVGLICFGIKVKRGSGLFALLDTILDTAKGEMYPEISPMWRLFGICVIVIAFARGMASLAFLVANGKDWEAAYLYQSHGALGWAEDVVLLAIFWLVFGVPYQTVDIRLPENGSAQRFLVAVIAGGASILSGTYLFLVSLGGGPLGNVKTGELVVAIVFTAVLVAPFYGFLARVVLHPDPSRWWRRVTREVRAALDQSARDKRTPCKEETPEAHENGQDVAAAPASTT